MQQMIKANDLLLQGQAQRQQSKTINDNSRLLNIPSFVGSIGKKQNDLSQTNLTTVTTSQEVENINLGIQGALPRYGLDYQISYTRDNQTQSAYSILPSINQKGDTLIGQINIDLLENAGYLVGNVPFDIRSANNEATKSRYNLTLQSSLLTLVNLYTSVVTLQQKIEITSRIESDALRLTNSYEALYKEGKISKVDMLSAQIQLRQQKVTIEALQIQLRESKRQLIYFVGGNDTFDISKDLFFKPFTPNLKPYTNKKTDILRGNPEIANLEKLKIAADLEVEALDNKLLPTLKFSLGYTDSSNPFTDNILTVDQNQINSAFATITLSIPLDNIAARTDLQVKKIERDNFLTRKNVLTDAVTLRLKGLAAEAAQTEAQLNITKEVEELSQQRFKSTIPLVKSNAQARIDIFTFQNQLISTQFDVIDYSFSLIRKQAEILYVKGTLYNSLVKSLR